MSFDGSTYRPRFDLERLTGQLRRVARFMADGDWHTLPEIQRNVGGSTTGISARLRDLRKDRFGGHTVERRRSGDPNRGLFEYRVVFRSLAAA